MTWKLHDAPTCAKSNTLKQTQLARLKKSHELRAWYRADVKVKIHEDIYNFIFSSFRSFSNSLKTSSSQKLKPPTHPCGCLKLRWRRLLIRSQDGKLAWCQAAECSRFAKWLWKRPPRPQTASVLQIFGILATFSNVLFMG